ncbi:CPA1 family monovalent cation:H+ antiporter [Allocatelliglobosispora scoriae]|uniref:CPA1 family monovalent cation:H+ antiporter n=1 Tax=Allocatelliglobosispora scoriae TaxID=643052 RepID=A0A841BWZ3_9ACTN|nr:sodium:proton antiporter [Allocatelliglobosispora scoriae]MBB5871250.1 CPA1 family monovalent cation:H+ antiporter [Allocatelliglobosispora scoriae]
MNRIELLFLAVGALVVAMPLASRLNLPYPVLLTIVGIGVALIPGVPPIELDPDLILPVLLPPLLWTAASRTSWTHLKANMRPILALAVALVIVSAFAAAALITRLIPGVPWPLAFAVGAAMAPPDPVAATSVAGRLGLPHRMVSVIEGEGLGNDATALTLFNTGLASAAVGGTISWVAAAEELVVSSIGGVAIGLLVALIARKVLDWVTDATLAGAFSVVLPFGAYAAADAVGASGVLAVLATAMAVAAVRFQVLDAEARLVGRAFWEILDLLLTAFAFILIGLELRPIVQHANGSIKTSITAGIAVCALLIGVRLAWLLGAGLLADNLRLTSRPTPANWREALVLGWGGMRGVVTIAAALSLPTNLPHRAELILVTFVVVMGTLVLPGITLPWLVKVLKVGGIDRDAAQREIAVRVTEAMVSRLDELRDENEISAEVAAAWRERARNLVAALSPGGEADPRLADNVKRMRRHREVSGELFAAAQAEALRLREDRDFDPGAVDAVLGYLDRRLLVH